MSSSSSNNLWNILHIVDLTENSKIFGYKKSIVLKQLKKPKEDGGSLVLADIRTYISGFPTKHGVCLTQYEFDWLAASLLHLKDSEQTLQSKSSARSLKIQPKSAGVVCVIQHVEDQVRKINLYKREVDKIVAKYGDFISLIDEMEEKQYEIEEGTDEVDGK